MIRSADCTKLSADTFERKVSDMKNKTRSILLGLLCAVCLQVQLNVGAVELPFVPVEETQAETTTAASETTAVTQKPAEQETPVITEAQATSKAADTTRASASEKSTPASDDAVSEPPASENTDSEINELPVLSPDGESTAEISESSSESSFSGEKNSSDTLTMANTDSKDITEASKESVMPIIIAAVLGVVVVAGAALFAIFRKRNKR